MKKHDGMKSMWFKVGTNVAWSEAYEKASNCLEKEHVPVLFHVEELNTTPRHSTSGSHERYKDERSS